MSRPAARTVAYVFLLFGLFAVAMAAGWSSLGAQIDNNVYDFLFRICPRKPSPPSSVLLVADEETLTASGGMRHFRTILAEGLERLAGARPKVVAVDAILADAGDEQENARLEAAFRKTPNLVLASELIRSGWEEPLERFRLQAAAVGHVHADPDPLDNVSRQLPMEKAAGRSRRWALAMETFRLWQGAEHIVETPRQLQVGATVIPSSPRGRALLVRYLPPPAEGRSAIPRISFLDLGRHPELAARMAGKAVFVGVEAQSAARDRLMTPYSFGQVMPGVEIHAHAFETLVRGEFLTPASPVWALLFCLGVASAAGFVFAFRTDWQAYGLGAGLVLSAHVIPYAAFSAGTVFPYAAPVSTAWLCVVGAASYQHFVVRRQLHRSESEKNRYQQAIRFVTHEMRTPLTAIQGSSELIGRYNLNDEKRKQIAQTINSESKRLARMIQTYLDVEKLSEGHLDLRREPFSLADVVDSCLERASPLAERKGIAVRREEVSTDVLLGDRELMEYAVYNLLTNAIKYSPPDTEIRVACRRENDRLRLSVTDQGIGMDRTELRNIFRKFYRTRKAEASGEAGTGIGLSIVEQIVGHHGGTMEVTSAPGRGSCFMMILPAPVSTVTAGN